MNAILGVRLCDCESIHTGSSVFSSCLIDLVSWLADDAARELKRKLRAGLACVPLDCVRNCPCLFSRLVELLIASLRSCL